MSVVTGVMLVTSCSEDESLLQSVDHWLHTAGFSALHAVEEQCCNGKHPQLFMRGGGYNYFKGKAFADYVSGLSWGFPEQVVLILIEELESAQIVRPARI